MRSRLGVFNVHSVIQLVLYYTQLHHVDLSSAACEGVHIYKDEGIILNQGLNGTYICICRSCLHVHTHIRLALI